MIHFNKILIFCVLFVSVLFYSIIAKPYEFDIEEDDWDLSDDLMDDFEDDEDVLNPEYSNEADPGDPIENDGRKENAKEMPDDTNIDEHNSGENKKIDEEIQVNEILSSENEKNTAFVEEETKRLLHELAIEENKDDTDIEEDNIGIKEDEEDNIEIEEDIPIDHPVSWYDRFKHYITEMGK